MDDQNEAIREQLGSGSLFGLPHRLEYETAKLVNELVSGSDLTKFTVSGTHGTTAAARLARAYTGKDKILKFEGMYHGHADGFLFNYRPAIGDMGSRRSPTKIPMEPGIPRATMETVEILPWNDSALVAEKLERHGHEIAAVITEPIMGNGGLVWPTDGFLEELRDLTHEHDVLLIFDEVVTGFRLALGGAQTYFGVTPDISVFGKAIGNGLPVGAMTGTEEVMGLLNEDAEYHGTYSGNPLALAGTKANLEALAQLGDGAYEQFHQRGRTLVDGLEEIAADAGHPLSIPDFAGYFYMSFTDGETNANEWTDWRDVGQNVDTEKTIAFARAMIGEGVFILPQYSRVTPTFSHTDEIIERTLEAAKTAIQAVEN